MAGKTPAKRKPARKPVQEKRQGKSNRTEIICIGVIAFSILLFLGVYFTEETSLFGIAVNRVLIGLFGIGGYVLPLLAMAGCAAVLMRKREWLNGKKITASSFLFLSVISLVHIIHNPDKDSYFIAGFVKETVSNGGIGNGGLLGAVTGGLMLQFLNIGAYIFIAAMIIVLLIIITGRSFFGLLNRIYEFARNRAGGFAGRDEAAPDVVEYGKTGMKRKKQDAGGGDGDDDGDDDEKKVTTFIIKPDGEIVEKDVPPWEEADAARSGGAEDEREISLKGIGIEGVGPEASANRHVPEEPDPAETEDDWNGEDTDCGGEEPEQYVFPPLELLRDNVCSAALSSKTQIHETAKKLEDTLRSFGVEARVMEVSKGPTVTRYELSPGVGVKVSRINGLADDIALNLAAVGIRIEAPIPGKSVVGIEIPNKEVQAVFLKEVIDDPEFTEHSSKLAFSVGKDIAGNVVVGDIEKMPHLLIAGATNSGKSVCINSIIMSILYKASPDEVKLLMIDPKVVELTPYNGIPHLQIPVVTDPKKAANTLNWGVTEMDERYIMFEKAGAAIRNLTDYNEHLTENGEKILPIIVIIIDELNDLMMTAPGDVEQAIIRLAQKGRAAGIHLIVATQRPSADVITGLIRANMPSRMAFAVSSGIDSRIIIEMNGAEKLIGKGDMLYAPLQLPKPQRVQGAYVSSKEIQNVVNFLKVDKTPDSEMVEKITTASRFTEADEDEDELFNEAVEFILDKDKVSISVLQRKFRVGFNRAARLVEELEARGVVGPGDAAKPRKVLMKSYQWDEYKMRKGRELLDGCGKDE